MEIDRSSTAASWRVMYIYILSARLAYMLINMQLHWCFCYTVGGMFVESELVRWCNQSRLNSKLCCNKSKMTDHVFGDVFALRPAITTNLLQKTATVLEKRLVFPPVGWLSAAYDATWLLMYFARASCLTSRAQNVGSPVKTVKMARAKAPRCASAESGVHVQHMMAYLKWYMLDLHIPHLGTVVNEGFLGIPNENVNFGGDYWKYNNPGGWTPDIGIL